jgi:hypothetical protein
MRKELFASLASKIAIGVAALALTAGTGGALMFSNASDSSRPDDHASETGKEHASDHDATTDDDATTEDDETTTSDVEASENTNDNHGADVSAVASDPTKVCDDNHGKYVSAVARGETPCATTQTQSHGKSGDHGPEASSDANDDDEQGKSAEHRQDDEHDEDSED